MCESTDTPKNKQNEKTENLIEKGHLKIFCQNSVLVNALYVKIILKEKGIEVLTNTDMEKAHALIQEYQPHLVLSDILDKPGGMTGFDLCRQHNACEATRHIPFCFLTSLQGDEFVRRAQDVGATHYMNLPMDKDILIRSIMQILSNSKNPED